MPDPRLSWKWISVLCLIRVLFMEFWHSKVGRDLSKQLAQFLQKLYKEKMGGLRENWLPRWHGRFPVEWGSDSNSLAPTFGGSSFLGFTGSFYLVNPSFQQFEINKERQKRPRLPRVIWLFPSLWIISTTSVSYILTSFLSLREGAEVSKRNHQTSILIFK